MKAYTYNDRLVGVGNDQILGTDQGGGSTYTAGNGIDITNDVISVDDTVAMKTDIPVVTGYIPYSASGVSLPNSKFEIDTNGQAYKVISPEHIDTETVTYNTDPQYIQWGQLVVTGDLSIHTGDTILVNNLDSRITSIDLIFFKGTVQWGTNNVPVTNNTATIISDRDYVYTDCTIFLYSNDVPYDYTTNAETLSITQTEVTPAVTEEYLTDGDLELNDNNQVTAIDGHTLAGGSGGTEYTAGQYISIDSNDVISVTGLQVAGNYATTSDISDMATKTWVGNQGYLTSVPEGYATDIEVSQAIASSIVQSDWAVTAVDSPAYIDNKPETLEMEISPVTGGNCISITEGNAGSIDWITTAGITDIVSVTALPANPVATVIYLIPET